MSVQQEQQPQSSSSSYIHRLPPKVPGPNTGKKYIPWKTHQIELLSQYLKEHVTYATSPSIDSCRIIKMEVFPDDEEVTPRRLFGKICNMRAAYRKLENSGLVAGVRGRRKSTNPAVYGGFVMSNNRPNIESNASEYIRDSRHASVTSTSVPGSSEMNSSSTTHSNSTSFTSAGDSSVNQSIHQSTEPRRKARRRRHYQMDSIYSEFDPNRNSSLNLNSASIANTNSKQISFNSLNRPINNNSNVPKTSSVVNLESSDEDGDDEDDDEDIDDEIVMDLLEKKNSRHNDINQFFQSNAQSTPNTSNRNDNGNSNKTNSYRSINSSDIVALLHHTLQTHLSNYPTISPSSSVNSSTNTSPLGAQPAVGNYGSSHNMLLTYLQSKLDQDAHINKLLIESLERIEKVKALAQIKSAKALEKCAGKLVTLMENEQLFQHQNTSNNATPSPPSSNPSTGGNTQQDKILNTKSNQDSATTNSTTSTTNSTNPLEKTLSKEHDKDSSNDLEEEADYKRENN